LPFNFLKIEGECPSPLGINPGKSEIIRALIACLHDQNKSEFLEGRLLSSQSEQFKKYSKRSDWLEKAGPP